MFRTLAPLVRLLLVIVVIAAAGACAQKADAPDAPAEAAESAPAERAGPEPWEDEIETLQGKLDAALEAENYPLAEALSLEAIGLLPAENAYARLEFLPGFVESLAFALSKQDKLEAAEERYRELLKLWEESPVPEETAYQRLPTLFEYAILLGERGKPEEQEQILKRAVLLSQSLVRRINGYYLEQPVQQAGGQTFASYFSSALLELARYYTEHKRYDEANQVFARAVWSVERLFAMDPAAVGEVRGYYEEFAAGFPDSVERLSFKPGVPSYKEAPAIAWLDVTPEFDEGDLLYWGKLWYEAQRAEGEGDLDTALERYLRGLDVARAFNASENQKSDTLLYSLSAAGRVLHKLGRDKEAADVFADSIEVRRGWDEKQLIVGLIESGSFYLSAHMTQEAAAALEEALPLVQKSFGNTHTNYALVRSLLADAAFQRGDDARAVEGWDRYLLGLEMVLGFPNEWLTMLFDDYAAALGNLKRSEQLAQLRAYRNALDRIPSFEPARRALIACRGALQQDRDVAKAKTCFDGALSAFPLFPSGYRFAGSSLLWFADANAESIAYFEQAINQFAIYPVVYNEMAYAYIGLEQLDAALGAAQFQVKLAPGDPNAYDTLGDVYKNRGEMKQAIEAFQTACALGMKTSCERRELQE